jgi:hypothetical protein
MNLKENFDKKAKELIKNVEILQKVKIEWQKIPIKCDGLTVKEFFNKELNTLKENKNSPAIYCFEITSNQTNDEIVRKLEFYKENDKKRAYPKIDRKRMDKNGETKFLYCGSKKEKLHERFIQHLGFGSESTYSLQLFHWAKELKLELVFHYAWLGSEQKQITELIESVLAERTKPLVGKIMQ